MWPTNAVCSGRLQGLVLDSTELDPHNHDTECDSDDRTWRVEEYDILLRFSKIRDQGECDGAECLM